LPTTHQVRRQLTHSQVLKASKSLLAHIKSTSQTDTSSKPNLLAEDEDGEDDSTPIWLTLTTKKHITDTKRLKPSKVTLPNSLNTSSTATICLITADPQRTYKDIIASPTFPSALAARITRVIDVTKLKAKYKQYEAQRKLFAEHDIFLADDRIITLLPRTLGKVFYKATTKRPVPINIAAPAPRSDGKRIARVRGEGAVRSGSPEKIAAEIEKAIEGALVHLSASTNTSVKVAYASWDAERIAENIEAMCAALVEKFVVKKWRGVRAFYIKGPETAALPIWLADELWDDEKDVVNEQSLIEANVGKKRKAIESTEGSEAAEGKKRKKAEGEAGEGKREKKPLPASNDDKLDKEIALRKEKLKKQKEQAAKDVGEDEVPKATKKTKKSKAAAV